MTTTQPELANQFRRLAAALDTAERTPGGLVKAGAARDRIAAAIDGAIAVLTNSSTKPAECDRHSGSPAHNCGPCRSERIGADQ